MAVAIYPRIIELNHGSEIGEFKIKNASTDETLLIYKIRGSKPKLVTFSPSQGLIEPGVGSKIRLQFVHPNVTLARVVVKILCIKRSDIVPTNFKQSWSQAERTSAANWKKVVEIRNKDFQFQPTDELDELSLSGSILSGSFPQFPDQQFHQQRHQDGRSSPVDSVLSEASPTDFSGIVSTTEFHQASGRPNGRNNNDNVVTATHANRSLLDQVLGNLARPQQTNTASLLATAAFGSASNGANPPIHSSGSAANDTLLIGIGMGLGAAASLGGVPGNDSVVPSLAAIAGLNLTNPSRSSHANASDVTVSSPIQPTNIKAGTHGDKNLSEIVSLAKTNSKLVPFSGSSMATSSSSIVGQSGGLLLDISGAQASDDVVYECVKSRLADALVSEQRIVAVEVGQAPLHSLKASICGVFHNNASDNAVVLSSGSELDYLRAAIFKDNLRYLTVSFTPLTTLDESINAFEKLVSLDLSHNSIRSIEGPLLLPKLQRLNLSHNRLKSLDFLQALVCLKTLLASSNELGTFLASVNVLVPLAGSLTSIDLSANPVCSHQRYSEEVINVLPNLRYFDARDLQAMRRSSGLNTTVQEKETSSHDSSFQFGMCYEENSVLSEDDNAVPSMSQSQSDFDTRLRRALKRQANEKRFRGHSGGGNNTNTNYNAVNNGKVAVSTPLQRKNQYQSTTNNTAGVHVPLTRTTYGSGSAAVAAAAGRPQPIATNFYYGSNTTAHVNHSYQSSQHNNNNGSNSFTNSSYHNSLPFQPPHNSVSPAHIQRSVLAQTYHDTSLADPSSLTFSASKSQNRRRRSSASEMVSRWPSSRVNVNKTILVANANGAVTANNAPSMLGSTGGTFGTNTTASSPTAATFGQYVNNNHQSSSIDNTSNASPNKSSEHPSFMSSTTASRPRRKSQITCLVPHWGAHKPAIAADDGSNNYNNNSSNVSASVDFEYLGTGDKSIDGANRGYHSDGDWSFGSSVTRRMRHTNRVVSLEEFLEMQEDERYSIWDPRYRVPKPVFGYSKPFVHREKERKLAQAVAKAVSTKHTWHWQQQSADASNNTSLNFSLHRQPVVAENSYDRFVQRLRDAFEKQPTRGTFPRADRHLPAAFYPMDSQEVDAVRRQGYFHEVIGAIQKYSFRDMHSMNNTQLTKDDFAIKMSGSVHLTPRGPSRRGSMGKHLSRIELSELDGINGTMLSSVASVPTAHLNGTITSPTASSVNASIATRRRSSVKMKEEYSEFKKWLPKDFYTEFQEQAVPTRRVSVSASATSFGRSGSIAVSGYASGDGGLMRRTSTTNVTPFSSGNHANNTNNNNNNNNSNINGDSSAVTNSSMSRLFGNITSENIGLNTAVNVSSDPPSYLRPHTPVSVSVTAPIQPSIEAVETESLRPLSSNNDMATNENEDVEQDFGNDVTVPQDDEETRLTAYLQWLESQHSPTTADGGKPVSTFGSQPEVSNAPNNYEDIDNNERNDIIGQPPTRASPVSMTSSSSSSSLRSRDDSNVEYQSSRSAGPSSSNSSYVTPKTNRPFQSSFHSQQEMQQTTTNQRYSEDASSGYVVPQLKHPKESAMRREQQPSFSAAEINPISKLMDS